MTLLSCFRAVLTTEMLTQNVLVPSLSTTYAWAPDDAVVICFTSGTRKLSSVSCVSPQLT